MECYNRLLDSPGLLFMIVCLADSPADYAAKSDGCFDRVKKRSVSQHVKYSESCLLSDLDPVKRQEVLNHCREIMYGTG